MHSHAWVHSHFIQKVSPWKRNAFSRLFFLSNEELRGIFLFTQEPAEDFTHLLKPFLRLLLVFRRNTPSEDYLTSHKSTNTHISAEKEPPETRKAVISYIRLPFWLSFNLQQSIRTLNVEPDQWLLSLQNSLQSSLRCQILTALFIISSNMKASKDHLSDLRQRNKRDFSPDKLSPSKSVNLLHTGISLQRSMTLSGLQKSSYL